MIRVITAFNSSPKTMLDEGSTLAEVGTIGAGVLVVVGVVVGAVVGVVVGVATELVASLSAGLHAGTEEDADDGTLGALSVVGVFTLVTITTTNLDSSML